MSKSKILIVEDDPSVADLLRECLEASGYNIFIANDGAAGLRQFFDHRPDLLIIDIIMPQMDGFQLCQRVRELSFVPIVVLTGIHNEEERVKAFSLGADDYVTKPVAWRELVARIEAHLRRHRWPNSNVQSSYSDSMVTVDYGRHDVYVRDQKKDLTPIEYRLLTVLISNQGETLSHSRFSRKSGGPITIPLSLLSGIWATCVRKQS